MSGISVIRVVKSTNSGTKQIGDARHTLADAQAHIRKTAGL